MTLLGESFANEHYQIGS